MQDYQAPQDLLDHNVILVTGAGEGIGAAAAKAFAAHGATVILLGKRIEQIEAVYDDIVAAGYPEPAIYPMDLSTANPDNYTEMARRITEEFGHLEGILHNASHLGSLTPIEHYSIKDWYEVMQTNTNAPFLLTKALIPLLKKSHHASIVFTTDENGRGNKAYWGAYCVANYANEGFAQVLAEELENTHVRVNCINPGIVQSQVRAKAFPAEDAQTLATPEDVMPTYLYMMGNDSAEVHGQSLTAQS
jgi:NAD(P)-dependent dehydrogenase (short-subunit alcohol dehydrogenase family)